MSCLSICANSETIVGDWRKSGKTGRTFSKKDALHAMPVLSLVDERFGNSRCAYCRIMAGKRKSQSGKNLRRKIDNKNIGFSVPTKTDTKKFKTRQRCRFFVIFCRFCISFFGDFCRFSLFFRCFVIFLSFCRF